jgi:hypothetical protein
VNEKIISLIVPTDQFAKIAAALLQPIGPPITEQTMIDGNTLVCQGLLLCKQLCDDDCRQESHDDLRPEV